MSRDAVESSSFERRPRAGDWPRLPIALPPRPLGPLGEPGCGPRTSSVVFRGFMKPSLVGRLMLAYTAVIAAVLVSTWWSQRTFARVEAAAQRLSERSVEALELTAKLERLLEQRSHVARFLLAGDDSAIAAIRPDPGTFAGWLEKMSEFARAGDERALLEQIRDSYAAYASKADAFVRLEESGRREDARSVFLSMANDVQRLLGDSQQLVRLSEGSMHERRIRAEATMNHARDVMLWLTGFGAILSLVVGFLLSRTAARPLYQLVLRLGASGVIDRVEVGGDEIGALETHVGALLDRVRQQERALQQAEKLSELGEIASEIAHETLNPVAGVKGMLQALRHASLPAERVSRELADMERELSRVEEIVRRLMRYARPLEPHMRSTPVQAILDRAAGSARVAPAARGRLIRVEPAPAGLCWVVDPDLIEQVLVNLLVNGCEASPPGAEVRLSVSVEARQLCLMVRDRGVGLGAVDRERLFHPFFTTKPHGHGLGLAISRNIVRDHGGQIEALEAQPGGSVFRVFLPERT